jgi:non-canonical purine NTP pyrophosphatase (RdgB/HAM1 family)
VSLQLVLASRNAHKVAELRRILTDADLSVELRTLVDFADVPDVVESGVTFADNALLKARAVAAATGLAAVGDDSGFCLDVLGGMPGVFSARWSGRHGDDRANLELVLAQVADVPDEKAALVYDYHAEGGPERTGEGLDALAALPYNQLLEFELLAVLGFPASTNPLDYSVTPRGYRVLSHIPRLPDGVVRRVVASLEGLEGVVSASQRELEAVEGVGAVRAREIREGLRRLQEHNLVDRYLQL